MTGLGYAVELYFDPEAEARVLQVWEALSERGIDPRLPALGARPHISLAVFAEVDLPTLEAVVERFARETDATRLSLSAVGTFPTAEGVVFLLPAVTVELLSVHARLHSRLEQAGLTVNPYYLPGRWIPHCTVATDLRPEAVPAAVEVCRTGRAFGEVRLLSAGIVRFRPVETLALFRLGER